MLEQSNKKTAKLTIVIFLIDSIQVIFQPDENRKNYFAGLCISCTLQR